MKSFAIAGIHIAAISKPRIIHRPVPPKHVKKPRTIEQILRNPLGG